MALPVVLIHGYSSEGKTDDEFPYSAQDVAAIYGNLAQELETTGVPVIPVNVSRYVSLDDGVGVDDVSLAFQRALKAHPALQTATGEIADFNAIVHSTGALVARNWIRRHTKPDGTCPLKRLIYLAGANLGSGWAHVGTTQFVRFARSLQGTQPGAAVLEDLELASSWAIDLHTHFLDPDLDMFHKYGVMEFSLVGSQTPPEYLAVPIRYGKEDGSDGVVRVSASNLNFNYIEIGPTDKALLENWDAAVAFNKPATDAALVTVPADQTTLESGYYEIKRFSQPAPPVPSGGGVVYPDQRIQVPFGIPYLTDHSDAEGESGIVSGSKNRQYVFPLVEQALGATIDTYPGLVATFEAATAATYAEVKKPAHDNGIWAQLKDAVKNLIDNPKGQYDPHAQVVFRVRDHLGRPVKDFSVFFNSFDGEKPEQLIDGLFEDHHQNNITPNSACFYLRVECWDEKAGDWVTRLDKVGGVTLEIDAVDPLSQRILYIPLRMHIPADELESWIQPHRTTIVDVNLMRLPHRVTFILK